MSKRVVFVIGASGNVGKATIKALSENYGKELDIRAGVRKPQRVVEFNSLPGVTVVQAEMGKRTELTKTFKDVQVLFIVVPGSGNPEELTSVTADAAKEAGVAHVLCIGSEGADKPEMILGKVGYNIEQKIKNLGTKYTIIRLPWFMDNYFGFKESLERFSRICAAIDPNKPYEAICMDDAGLAAAAILAFPEKHEGKTYYLTSDRHTYNDLAKAFSQVLGKDIKYVQWSYDEDKKGMLQFGVPEWMADGLVEFLKMVNDGLYENVIAPGDFTIITGKQPTDLLTWVKKYAGAFK